MPHPVIWFEVIGKDAAALSSFYSDLFDWKVDPVPNDYFMVTTEGDMASGGVGSRPVRRRRPRDLLRADRRPAGLAR